MKRSTDNAVLMLSGYSMKELHERLKANELRQKDIDRQLQSLDIDGPPSPS